LRRGLSILAGLWKELSREKEGARDIDALQVEVTTRCNHRCPMCPNNYLQRESLLDLDWGLYERLARFFPRVKLVYLQGWGEPLLHPRFFDMVARAREKGCRTGFTTNGALLDEDAAREAIRLEVEYVTVSLAGASADTHNRIRRGSDFERLVANVKRLVAERKNSGRQKPRVHLSFMMTRSSIAQLPAAVRLAHEAGADHLVAPNLDHPVTPEDEQDRIFDWGPPAPVHRAAIEEASALAAELGIRFTPRPLDLREDVLVCELNPLRQLYVNVHGEISPCVYASVLGERAFQHYFRGARVTTESVVFGSLAEEEAEAIWEGEECRGFRGAFERRFRRYDEIARAGGEIHDLITLRRIHSDIDRALGENPPPQLCRTCYKACGA
jgi:MoaA/NifB/PqqE/SkfB family radical SAM enzyme